MTPTVKAPNASGADRSLEWTVIIIFVVTAWRVLCLAYNEVTLFVDESQYWLWGQELAFGYYSKPPLIGWAIRASNVLGGSDTAFWVRLPAQIFHGVTAVVIALLARAAWDSPKAAWAGAAYVTLPGVTLLAVFVSTDDLLLTAVALMLLAVVKLRQAPSRGWAITLGLAIGFGLMAKYAMAFLVLLLLATQIVPRWRIASQDLIWALLIAAVIVAPNLYWNVQNGFITFAHTGENANWQGIAWNWTGAAEFLGVQILAFGLILGPAFLGALSLRGWPAGWLHWFSLPIFAAILMQAVIVKANGNWAAPAFVAGTVLVSGWLVLRAPRLLAAGIALNAVIALALPVTTIWPDHITLRGESIFARAQDLDGLGTAVIAAAEAHSLPYVIAQDRAVLAHLSYVTKGTGLAIFAVPPAGPAQSHYELTRPALTQPNEALFVGRNTPSACAGDVLASHTGRASRAPFVLSRIQPGCLEAQ